VIAGKTRYQQAGLRYRDIVTAIPSDLVEFDSIWPVARRTAFGGISRVMEVRCGGEVFWEEVDIPKPIIECLGLSICFWAKMLM
jgi:hypothetical protein